MLGSLVANLYRTDVKPAVEGFVPADVAERISDSFGSVGAQTAELAPAVAASVTAAADQSFVDALNVGYLAAAGFIVVALIVAARMIPKDLRAQQAEAPELDEGQPREGRLPMPAPGPAIGVGETS